MYDKITQYAVLIHDQISLMFSDESENQIDITDFQDEENAKAFIHALATVAPNLIYAKLFQDDKNNLEFNHIANFLCFEFSNKVESNDTIRSNSSNE